MADNSDIEWTDATWNPITGCSVVSPGCTNCYAMRLAGTRLQHHPSRAGLTRDTKAGPVWTGEVRLNEQWLDQPLRWKRPRRIFVCAHGDLFHESVPFGWVMRVFNTMVQAPQHTFQILTKRADRMRDFFTRWADTSGEDFDPKMVRGPAAVRATHPSPRGQLFADMLEAMGTPPPGAAYPTFDWMNGMITWPNYFPNIWLGVSAEDQQRADARIPDLLATPAAVRWVSAEPLLGPMNMERVGTMDSLRANFPDMVARHECETMPNTISGMQIDSLNGRNQRTVFYQTPDHMGGFSIHFPPRFPRLDWVVAGGESGPGARPMHPDWARSLRDQCATAGVPFFFKQWGEWQAGDGDTAYGLQFYKIGKAKAGRLLDGREHNEVPG